MAKRIITRSPAHIRERNIETYNFTGEWTKIFGSPDIRFSSLIRGEAKSGKSSYCTMFAKEVSQWGKVLYVSAEERINSVTLQERLKRFDVTSRKIRFTDARTVDEIDQLLRRGGFRFIIIDSIQHVKMTIDDWTQLRNKYKRRKLSWHLVSQMGKNVIAYKHEVDAIVEIKAGLATVSGRFKQSDTFRIFDNKNNNTLFR